MKNITIASIIFLLVSGCSATEKKESITETNPYTLYQKGMDALQAHQYKASVQYFEQIEKEHPASELAPEAQIRRAYAYYLDGNYSDTIFTVDSFIKQYPGHKDIAYMYYLKALSYYNQIVDIGRDQHMSGLAINALTELINRFPNAQYTRDAQIKLEFAYNSLAGKEMSIGMFYLKNEQISAAINRFKTIVDQYEKSIFIEEALYRLVEIYYYLGVEDEAAKYAAVLGYNYPESRWYKKAYKVISSHTGALKRHQKKSYKELLKKIW